MGAKPSAEAVHDFIKVVCAGDTVKVNKYLSSRQGKHLLVAKDRFGQSAVHWAAYRDQVSVITLSLCCAALLLHG